MQLHLTKYSNKGLIHSEFLIIISSIRKTYFSNTKKIKLGQILNLCV